MKGLLIKDSLILIKQLKILLIIIPVIAITGNASMAAIAIILGASLPMTAIAYDEQSKWEYLAQMMPYTRKELVLGKYILGYIGILGSTSLYIISKCIMNILSGTYVVNMFYPIYFAIICGLFFIAINTPILFKYGTQKGKYLFIIFIVLVSTIGSFLRRSVPDLTIYASYNAQTVLLIVAIILNIISVFISLQVKSR